MSTSMQFHQAGARRAGQLGALDPVLPGARRLLRGGVHRHHVDGRRCSSWSMFLSRGFFVTAGYHRYFSHKSFKLNRFWQFVFAFGAEATAQKGVAVVGVATTATTTATRDTDRDLHSPRKGFWWSHVGWILADKYKPTNMRRHQGLRQVPGAALPEQARLDRAVDVRCRRVPDRRLAGSRRRVLLVDGAAVAHARSS